MTNYLEEYQQLHQAIKDCLDLPRKHWNNSEVIEQIAATLVLFEELVPNA